MDYARFRSGVDRAKAELSWRISDPRPLQDDLPEPFDDRGTRPPAEDWLLETESQSFFLNSSPPQREQPLPPARREPGAAGAIASLFVAIMLLLAVLVPVFSWGFEKYGGWALIIVPLQLAFLFVVALIVIAFLRG